MKLKQAQEELGKIYGLIYEKIEKRILDFKIVGEEGSKDRIFMELVFCLLTPASKAKNAWKAVKELKESGVLYSGNKDEIAKYLNIVRFKNNKALNILKARALFYEDAKFQFNKLLSRFDSKAFKVREWLVQNVRGFAYKESTHFLRNIGRSDDLCILDRHILRNLNYYDVITEIPQSLTELRYLDIEIKMQEFSKMINIPVTHLDLLLWYKETGEVYK